MGLTKYEQETIINFNEKEKLASVYTHNLGLQNTLLSESLEKYSRPHHKPEPRKDVIFSYLA